MNAKKFFSALLFLTLLSLNLFASTANKDPLDRVISLNTGDFEEIKEVNGTKTFLLDVYLDIEPGYYVYADSFNFDLTLNVDSKITKREFPEALKRFDKYLKKETSIYNGENRFKLYLEIPNFEKIKKAPVKVKFSAAYQGCSYTTRYPLKTVPFEYNQNFDDESLVHKTKKDLTKLWEKGFILALLSTFLLGILGSLTPCVYPIIPIVVSVVSSRSVNKRWKSFVLSSLFALGIAIVYSIGGFLAAESGSIMGSFFQSDFAVLLVALVFLAMGLALIGLFELKLPLFISKRISGIQGEGYAGTFAMGIVTGLVAIPCIGPFAASLISLAAESANPMKGFLLLFSFSIGLSLLFLIVGTFSSLIANLPKPGSWMIILKKIMGLVLVGVALYYVYSMLPELLSLILIGIILFSATLLFRKMDPMGLKSIESFHQKISIVCLILGIVLFLSLPIFNYFIKSKEAADELPGQEKISWIYSKAEAFQKAKQLHKPIMIDFFATWCSPCKKLDKNAFRDKSIVDKSKEFITLRVDMSKSLFDISNDITKKYAVYGIPTILFLTPNGGILESHRIIGGIDAEPLLETMDKVMALQKKGNFPKSSSETL